MKITKKSLVVLVLAVLLVVSLVTTVKAGGSTINELEAFFWEPHTICGKTYELTLDQKKAASDFLIPDTGVTITDSEVKLALAKLNSAINTLNESGAKSISEVPSDVVSSALSLVQEAGNVCGVSVNVDSSTKNITVVDTAKGVILGSANYSKMNIGTVGSVSSNTYKALEGENQLYNVADAGELKFRFDVDYSYFNGGKVYMDDVLVDPSNYTSKSGSTIITFKTDYSKKLSLGDHIVKVEFNNGKVATAKFRATHVTGSGPAPAAASAQPTSAGSTFVYTGSNTNIAYIAVSLLAVVAVSIAFVKKVYVK